MLVLHMAELDGHTILWGESPQGNPTGKEITHPWSATPKELKGVLKSKKYDMLTTTVWLPTARKKPTVSSGMIAEHAPKPTRISPWTVAARRLTAQETADLLAISHGRRTLDGGIVLGHDMQWWADMFRWAGAIVARQQYLPDIIHAGRYQAVWNPVFIGEDAERLESAAARMPASVRSLTSDSKKPKRSPKTVLWCVMSQLVDHMVRQIAITQHGGRMRRNFDSIHDAWLHALRTPYRTIQGTSQEIQDVALRVREWQQPVTAMAGSALRLCFRVEEPTEKSDDWNIRYLVQPIDDPSTLIPLNEARRAKKWSGQQGSILLMLGQATQICPDIGRGISDAMHIADTAGAYRFLTQEAEALRQAGYGVMLPSWWTGRSRRLVARANVRHVPSEGSGMLSMDSMLVFDWEVALGDHTLTRQELENMADLKLPLVRVRGQWVEVSSEEIRSVIALMGRSPNGTLRDAIHMELGMGDVPEGLQWEGISGDGPIQNVLERLRGQAKLAELEPPAGFVGDLRPYQKRGYGWLAFLRQWGLGGCLADDMGLGKTIQMLALIQHDRKNGEKRPALLVCPTSVVSNWKRESAKFTPDLPVLIHHGADRTGADKFAKLAAGHAMVITSYGLLHRDIKAISGADWSGVILDEAQNIKNHNTKAAKAARSIRADYQFALTGTPVENNVMDLWSIMEFLNPKLLGNHGQFRRNYFKPIQTGQDKNASGRLRRATGPFMLRRLKTDKDIISDLPDKIEIKEYCTMTKEQAALYRSTLKVAYKELKNADDIRRRGIILATLSKLKQICNHPAHFLKDNSSVPQRSGKTDRLMQMLEEVIETGDRALVFTQFVEMGHMLQRHIQETFGLEVLFLHGGTSRRQRDHMVERFGKGPAQIFIVSLKAGGTGLNLTAANHVFHFDRWWNPAVENQATDRAFRIGQTRNVQVRKMICLGTLEEKIDGMMEKKKAIAGSVVESGERMLTELSNEDLRHVLEFSAEAV